MSVVLLLVALVVGKAAAQCSLSDLVVSNGVAYFDTTDSTAQSALSMTEVADGASAWIACNKGYLNSAGDDQPQENACSGTAWSKQIRCEKNKGKYGLRPKEARALCVSKFSTSTSQKCGFWEAGAGSLINGPCDAATDRKCPFHRDTARTAKNYNFCACLVA